MTWQINSTSYEQTEQIGADIGSRLRGGEVIELRSDLGGGKTTFVRGIAKGAGSPDAAGSPSFTIMRVYQTDNLAIHHYDFYRLAEAGIMTEELHEAIADPHVVCIVEWADVVENVLPADRLIITITASDENERTLDFVMPSSYEYLRIAS